MIKAIIFDFFGVLCTYVGFDSTVILNRELLDMLKTLKPKYKLAILSNASQELIEQALKEHDSLDLFSAVVTSSKTGLTKPQPEIFELTLSKLQTLPGETMFIDDSSSNVAAAKELGITSVLYKGLENLSGEFTLKKIH